MDFIVSYYLHKKLIENKKLKNLGTLTKKGSSNRSKGIDCKKCGQNPYFCVCPCLICPFPKSCVHKFDFENSKY